MSKKQLVAQRDALHERLQVVFAKFTAILQATDVNDGTARTEMLKALKEFEFCCDDFTNILDGRHAHLNDQHTKHEIA